MEIATFPQYPRIKIAKASESRLEIQKNRLTASQLDLEMEIRMTDEYLGFKMEEQLRDQVKVVSSKLCEITQHDLKHREISPFSVPQHQKKEGQVNCGTPV